MKLWTIDLLTYESFYRDKSGEIKLKKSFFHNVLKKQVVTEKNFFMSSLNFLILNTLNGRFFHLCQLLPMSSVKQFFYFLFFPFATETCLPASQELKTKR